MAISSHLVYVRWFDSAIYQGGTYIAEDLTGPTENETAGLLVADDEENITVALDFCRETNAFRCVLCIPKVNVRCVEHFHSSPEGD